MRGLTLCPREIKDFTREATGGFPVRSRRDNREDCRDSNVGGCNENEFAFAQDNGRWWPAIDGAADNYCL